MFGMTDEQVADMDKDLKELQAEENRLHDEDKKLLDLLNDILSPDDFAAIEAEVIESEYAFNFRIVDTAVGDPQEEEGITIWVDQVPSGDTGDVFTGTVCIELPSNKFLMWDYRM